MTHREFIEKLVEKQNQLDALKLQWDILKKQSNDIEARSQKLLFELNELVSQAKFISGDFTPDEIIGNK